MSGPFEIKLVFLDADKCQSLLQVYFKTLSIKVSYKMILSLFMGMIKAFLKYSK